LFKYLELKNISFFGLQTIIPLVEYKCNLLTLTEYEILRLAMHIYRYIIKNNLIYIHYDPKDDDIIKKISSYEILPDNTISEIKQSYDMDDMPYSLYINSLVTLSKLNLF
jgi:hypothetical protein